MVPESTTAEVVAIRQAINAFLHDRLQPKLDKLAPDDDLGRQQLIEAHQPQAWIADAAKRVGQIQLVTHAVKFTHASAGGSNQASSGNSAASALEIGTHILGQSAEPDVVGNAATLDVFKFLNLPVAGRTLLQRTLDNDPSLAAALSDDPQQAVAWMAAFAALPEAKGRPASHTLARQIYWPVEGGYHLLAPLFASSLAHAMHARISAHRFGDAAKAAREASRLSKAHPEGYRDYPNHAIQNFGGSKPQNISQLNSIRRGQNYLLANLPPAWRSEALKPPLKTETVFTDRSYFAYRAEVKRVLPMLREFLDRLPENINNQPIRDAIQGLAQALVDEVLQMAAELRELEPGWSAGEQCQLNRCEQLWLDPERGKTDAEFAKDYALGAWRDELCERFSLWLNRQLQTKGKTFGADEARSWSGLLEAELKLLREDMSDD